jgi:hypothetical protein
MCIYCTTGHYRKIYESHHGQIPIDEAGKTYEIHHIDGNHSNNHPDNLEAVTIQEHYNIHYAQEDWAACMLIAIRMEILPKELSQLSSAVQKKKVEDGTHRWLKKNGGGYRPDPQVVSAMQKDRFANGTHHWLTDEFEEKRKSGYFASLEERKAAGTFHLMTNNPGSEYTFKKGHNINQERLASGNHPSQIKKTCLHCNKIVDSANYARYHGDKCKMKELTNVD